MTTSCTIYARAASVQQGGGATDEQVGHRRELAEAKGWNVIEVCTDAPGSGNDASRPGLLTAMELARSGRAAVLLVQDIARLSRDAVHLASIQGELKAAGGQIITVEEGLVGDLRTGTPGRTGALNRLFLADLAGRAGTVGARQDRSDVGPWSRDQQSGVVRARAEA